MYDIMILCVLVLFCAGCCRFSAPFPNNLNPVGEFDVVRDFDLKGGGLVWYAHPWLFFNVTFYSQGEQ